MPVQKLCRWKICPEQEAELILPTLLFKVTSKLKTKPEHTDTPAKKLIKEFIKKRKQSIRDLERNIYDKALKKAANKNATASPNASGTEE